jgi:DNA-binding IclR family transcriptional regulator
LFELGEHIRNRTDIYNVAKPEIDELADETGERANLMIEDHGRGVYLYIARGGKAVNLDTRVGTRQYLHTSALGKAILAHMADEDFESVINEHGLTAETPNTVTDRSTLERELKEIREQGVAFDGEERAEGIRCVAAPITDKDETLLGAVSVSGPSSRLKGDWFHDSVTQMVRDTATVIGINVSYR